MELKDIKAGTILVATYDLHGINPNTRIITSGVEYGVISINCGYISLTDDTGSIYAIPLEKVPQFFSIYKSVNPKVDHPTHYGGADNTYEAIKVIEAWELGFNLGNTVKYISRAGKKDDMLQDLEKARWYLDREIVKLKNKKDIV